MTIDPGSLSSAVGRRPRNCVLVDQLELCMLDRSRGPGKGRQVERVASSSFPITPRRAIYSGHRALSVSSLRVSWRPFGHESIWGDHPYGLFSEATVAARARDPWAKGPGRRHGWTPLTGMGESVS